ncbi:MAG: endolytic transglycosylase MltG [Rhodoferax sp.]|nr:endolytic transglycosylase MltG [Rhodoferax sp.]
MRRFFLWMLMVTLALGGASWWWTAQPLPLGGRVIDLAIEPGTTAKGVAKLAVEAGVQTSPQLLYWWFRLSGQARQIKAGSYELEGVVTPHSLLAMLVRGDEALRAVTLVEGLSFKQFRQILQKEELLAHDTQGLAPDLIMQQLGRPGLHPEGRFYPDTYSYAKGSSELALLARALRAMDHQLAFAWQQRAANSLLKTPDQLLTLASIVEKETGRVSDRPLIAAVFTNRLRLGMLLQTDPTVIYGLGDQFDGNLRRRDLLADTPWNSYTRAGLPPTPIAMPGKASLLAAAQPANSRALYFVARGDGSSQFSETLDAHNRAVNQFQRRQ